MSLKNLNSLAALGGAQALRTCWSPVPGQGFIDARLPTRAMFIVSGYPVTKRPSSVSGQEKVTHQENEKKDVKNETKEGLIMVPLKAQKTTQQQDIEFYTRCTKVARARGYGRDVYEDFPAWAYERMKGGSRSTIDQMLVDYLRTTFGVSGTSGQQLRKAVSSASDNYTVLDLTEADPSSSPSARLEKEQLWALVDSAKDREMLQLYFCDGLSKKEIGELYGVTEARISQRMKTVLTKMRSLMDGA